MTPHKLNSIRVTRQGMCGRRRSASKYLDKALLVVNKAMLIAAFVSLCAAADTARAADCNNNTIDDAVDIANGTSLDCDANGIPDECQSDSDNDGTIDACDSCGQQLTNTAVDENWGVRHKNTSRGKAIWFDANSDIYAWDGTAATLVQAFDAGTASLAAVESSVFALGSGGTPGSVIGAWRRGTDFAWVWPGTGAPVLVNYTSPYNAADAMNPEGVTIAAGCVYMLFQAFDANFNVLIKHVYRINPTTGSSTLLTGDFLGDTATGGVGAGVTSLYTSGCRAVWSWCGTVTGGACTNTHLHYYDGTSVHVINDPGTANPVLDAVVQSFSGNRLIYSKVVSGVTQLFLFDANFPVPEAVQLTNFTAGDKRVIFAQTDGRHVAILRGDVNGLNREIVLLGGFPITNALTRPTNTPPNFVFPIQFMRGQLLWTTASNSVKFFDGNSITTVCAEGWLSDGFVAQRRKTATTGTDYEVFLYAGTPPNDAAQPAAPLIVTTDVTQDGHVALAWEPILGASSYNVYYAEQAGVTKTNYATLPGGTRLQAVNTPLDVAGLSPGKSYFFVVTTIVNANQGPISREVSAVPCASPGTDTDGDSTPDCADECPNDPDKIVAGACGCGTADTDTDLDGTPDCIDGCPNDIAKTAAGTCGCGTPDTDTDGDTVPDCNDNCPNDTAKTEPGDCGCGTADTDSDGDGAADCLDGCPNDAAKTAAGVCGCGVAETDADGDGTPDCIDGPCNISPNHTCLAAIDVGDGTFTGCNSGAGTENSSSCANSGANLWWRYSPSASGSAEFQSCESGIDTVLSVYDGCGGSELGCSDDADACGTGGSRVGISVVAGSHYIVRVAGKNGAVGDLTLRITTSIPNGNTNANDNVDDNSNGNVDGDGNVNANGNGGQDGNANSADGNPDDTGPDGNTPQTTGGGACATTPALIMGVIALSLCLRRFHRNRNA